VSQRSAGELLHVILSLSVNAEVYPQNSYNRWPYLSIIPINKN